jgi:hypothetical protein
MTNELLRVGITAFLCTIGVVAVGCSSSSSATGAPPDASSSDDASIVGSMNADTGAADTSSGSNDGSPTDASTDSSLADNDVGTDDAAAAPTCGPPPDRYTLLTGDADAGLVRDNVTGLIWMTDSVGGAQTQEQTQTLAATYCSGRGMRLPTEAEALALASNYASCAFGQWSTWTSTDVVGNAGFAWIVNWDGSTQQDLADNFPNAVLCVLEPTG